MVDDCVREMTVIDDCVREMTVVDDCVREIDDWLMIVSGR